MKKFNIILVVIDCARYDHISYHGYNRQTTPNIDALAKDCVVYHNHFTTAGWTLPSVSSTFTGLFPHSHGMHNENTIFDNSTKTAAQILSENGYDCHLLATNDWLSNSTKINIGFSNQPDFQSSRMGRLIRNIKSRLGISTDKGSKKITDYCIKTIKEKINKPNFTFILFPDTHLPYYYPANFASEFTDGNFLNLSKSIPGVRKHYAGINKLNNETQKNYLDLYDGSLKYSDFCIGKIIQNLKREEIYDDSMLIITADHGENLGDNGHMDHYYTLDDNLIHVPLFVKYPNSAKVGDEHKLVQNIDLLPTITDILDIKTEGLDGISLLSNEKRDYVFSERFKDYKRGVSQSYPDLKLDELKLLENSRRISIRDKKFKIVWEENGHHKFYDVSKPSYQKLISNESPFFQGYLDKAEIFYRENFREIKSSDALFDDRAMERLRALGYVE